MILTFHWVRECKISNNLIFMWIMRSFLNPVKKTLKGDTSDLLGDNSISLRFYQFKRLVIFPKLCLYNGDIYHLGLGYIISFIKGNKMQSFRIFGKLHQFLCPWINTQSTSLRLWRPQHTFVPFFVAIFLLFILRQITQDYELLSKVYFGVTFSVKECIYASGDCGGYFEKYRQIWK